MSIAFAEVSSSSSPESMKNYNPVSKKEDFMPAEELRLDIQGCASNKRESQKRIYSAFYGYMMAVCNRYTNNPDDAIEILNDGFLKVFKEIHRYKPAYDDEVNSFKGWVRKIMVYTAIDHFRRNHKQRITTSLDNGVMQVPAGSEDALNRISYGEILKSLREVTPGYRTVLSLFIIEGFSHEEISRRLGISIGTSKSNLAKGKKQFQKILFQQNNETLLQRFSTR